jgi:cobaltochelatase CobT
MNNLNLRHAFPIVAAALGNKFGVNVSVGGQDAYTDGSSINLPAYQLEDPSYQDVAWGYLAHEAAHLRFTDFAEFRNAANRPIRKTLVNILEDIRIEKAMQHCYPGTKQTIEKVIEHLLRTNGFQFVGDAQSVHPAVILSQFLLFHLRNTLLSQNALSGYAECAETLLKASFPTGVVSRLMALLTAVPQLTSTGDCVRLTDRLLGMLEEEMDNAQNQHTAAGTANSQPPCSQHSDERSQTDAQILASVLSARPDELIADVFETAQQLLGSQPMLSYDHKLRIPLAVEPVRNDWVGATVLTKALAESGKIRASLQGLVQASRLDRPVHKRYGHRLEGRKLARLSLGDGRLFIHRHHRQAPNTAIHLLLDASRSMRDSSAASANQPFIEVAIDAVVTLALALEGIPGVNPAITRFPCGQTDNVTPLLQHGQQVRTNQSVFSYEANGSSTPLHTALWYAAAKVLATPEPRKVIMVITDGAPDDPEAVKRTVQQCQASGIELMGVGIAMAISHLFANSMCINQVTELRAELFRISRELFR